MKREFITVAGKVAENHGRTKGTFEVRYFETKVFTHILTPLPSLTI